MGSSQKNIHVSERPVSSSPDNDFAHDQEEGYSQEKVESHADLKEANWRPGYLVRFPWIGVGCLLLVLLCGIGCLITLVVADGTAKVHWGRLAPNVIVSILNSVANLAFGLAISNGIAIAWWRKTLRGTTISQLNRSWQFSSSIKDVLLGVKYFNLIALAALAAKV